VSGPNVEDYTGETPEESAAIVDANLRDAGREGLAPGWTRVDAAGGGGERWRLVDEIGVMHLLLKVDARFYELHGLTLHVYRGPTDVVDGAWPMGDPSKYDPAVHNFSHVSTNDVTDTALARYTDEDDAWKWLVRYAAKYASR
jgi:hypothetical protein